jgi:chorismate mutase
MQERQDVLLVEIHQLQYYLNQMLLKVLLIDLALLKALSKRLLYVKRKLKLHMMPN